MGKIYQGILGPVSGKIGGTVGSSWKGISTVKGYQPIVSNPKTAAQVANREKMAFVVLFAQTILATVIKPLWDRFASRMSGYNAFVSANKALFTTEMPSNFENLKTSVGKMDATPISACESAAASKNITIHWVDDSGQGFKLGTDKAFLVAISEGTGVVKGFNLDVPRSGSIAVAVMDANLLSGDTVHLYLSFLRADGSVVSNNSYFEETVL